MQHVVFQNVCAAACPGAVARAMKCAQEAHGATWSCADIVQRGAPCSSLRKLTSARAVLELSGHGGTAVVPLGGAWRPLPMQAQSRLSGRRPRVNPRLGAGFRGGRDSGEAVVPSLGSACPRSCELRSRRRYQKNCVCSPWPRVQIAKGPGMNRIGGVGGCCPTQRLHQSHSDVFSHHCWQSPVLLALLPA